MAYCRNCGMENEEGSRYCAGCGMELVGASPVDYSPRQAQSRYANGAGAYYGTDVRLNSMNELTRMFNYFSQKSDQYNEFDRLSNEADSLRVYNPKAMLIFGIIVAAIGFFYLILGPEFGQSAGMVVVWLLMILGGGGLIAGYILKKKQAKGKLVKVNARLDELAEELIIHYNNYGSCPVGVEYTYPESINRIYSIIQAGRADTIKEAINTITDDEHKEEMERLQRQTAEAAKAAAINSGIAAANTARTAAYARNIYYYR